MELTDEVASKLSRTEIRKQKLAEYLAAKGRLKPPNPKPYLKSSAVLTKPPGAMQKSHPSGEGKENSAPSATGAKKDIAKGNALAEKNRNLRILPKASSALLPRLPLKSAVSQTASQQARTHCKETAHAVRNSSVKEQQTKPALHTNVTAHKQDKTVKMGPASVSSQAQPLHRPSMNARTSIVKTDLQKRRLVTGSEKPTVQAPVPQTLPRPTKTSSLTRGPVQPKTPKSTFNPGTDGVRTVPMDGRNKPTTAQEERMRKLKEWREAKGITYKRPPMPVQPARRKMDDLPPQGYWSTMEQEDEVHGFVCAVDQSLNDCIKLLHQGCPVDQVRNVLSRVPMAQKFAKYWICQVRLMEQEGNLDVLPTFEEAVRVVREPVDELRSVVFEILKKKEEKGSSSERENDVGSDEDGELGVNVCTPKPVGALIRGEKRDSSVIKYKITATPGGKRSQQSQRPGRADGHEIRFFTPVRRSLRIEKTASRYPAVLQEHDTCVTSVHELLTDGAGQSEISCTAEAPTSPLYVYRENDALKDHVQIQLVYADTDAS
ncbi:hypothetical protein PDJAM_G00148870 [Pangasius djambal]|uniref:Uncharacterized protein n=1 Tax=Pangasius djambal TaxID=1691987 RepID=A0ACC5ZG81_9TELE|nr:hypothetical protein [Pangasius djambal]